MVHAATKEPSCLEAQSPLTPWCLLHPTTPCLFPFTQAGVNQSASGSSAMYFHRLRLLVPPFPLESINWPSYVMRQKVRHATRVLLLRHSLLTCTGRAAV